MTIYVFDKFRVISYDGADENSIVTEAAKKMTKFVYFHLGLRKYIERVHDDMNHDHSQVYPKIVCEYYDNLISLTAFVHGNSRISPVFPLHLLNSIDQTLINHKNEEN